MKIGCEQIGTGQRVSRLAKEPDYITGAFAAASIAIGALGLAAHALPARAADAALPDFESPFAAVAERVLPAVVSIDTERFEPLSRIGPSRDRRGLRLRDIFPDAGWEEPDPASGSGFVLKSDGLIVTNHHVVEGAGRIRVTLHDGTTHDAEIVGLDPSTDIALLRIATDAPLPAVTLGSDDEVRVGDWAMAIGNPFGKLEGSVTVGVISAKGRANIDIEGGTPTLQDFIQTDASINVGNSGGPLVNVRGRVVGMNTAVSPAGQGISFAIPVGLLRSTVEQIAREGRAIRGFLGIYPQRLTPELAAGRGIPEVRGVLVGQVLQDTPAARGRLERGDVITHIGGRVVTDVSSFRIAIAGAPIGEPVEFTLRRGRERLRKQIILIERPGQVNVPPQPPAPARRELTVLGLELAELSPEIRESMGLDGREQGLVILGVTKGSAAEEAGIKPGAVIKEVGERTIHTLDEFADAVGEGGGAGRPIVLLIRRDGLTRFVAVSASSGESP